MNQYTDIMKPEEIKYEVTLTKSQTFELKPFGYFLPRFVKSSSNLSVRTIPASELECNHNDAYPMSEEQQKEFVKAMKKYKTDIFTDGGYRNFYTLTNSGITPVFHKKLQQYREDEGFRMAVDGDRESQGL